jgi:hypothetical protein
MRNIKFVVKVDHGDALLSMCSELIRLEFT